MTPPDLDMGVVQARLRLIEGLLDDLERAGDLTADMLERDRMLRHAIERSMPTFGVAAETVTEMTLRLSVALLASQIRPAHQARPGATTGSPRSRAAAMRRWSYAMNASKTSGVSAARCWAVARWMASSERSSRSS